MLEILKISLGKFVRFFSLLNAFMGELFIENKVFLIFTAIVVR